MISLDHWRAQKRRKFGCAILMSTIVGAVAGAGGSVVRGAASSWSNWGKRGNDQRSPQTFGATGAKQSPGLGSIPPFPQLGDTTQGQDHGVEGSLMGLVVGKLVDGLSGLLVGLEA